MPLLRLETDGYCCIAYGCNRRRGRVLVAPGSHSTVRLQHQSLTSPHMRNSLSHPILHEFEGIRSRTTRPSFCASVLKKKCTRGITSLTGSSSHEELNRPGTFGAKTATPAVGLLPDRMRSASRGQERGRISCAVLFVFFLCQI